MGFFLGIDLGTSYFKAGIFDKNGNIKGLGRRFVKKRTGDGSICELPVATFWETLHFCIGEALQEAGITPEELNAVSYSSQANSFILLDGSNEPLTPLVLWPDKRAEGMGLQLMDLFNENGFIAHTGLGIAPNCEFAIAKINWFQKKQPKLWQQAKSILSISDYLTFWLTGQKKSDFSTASITGLLDVFECRWWEKPLDLFSLNPELLPIPKRTGSFIGGLTGPGAAKTGLIPGIPYYLGALDHHCAAIGSGIVQNDNVCESTGTVLSCVGHTGKFAPTGKCCVSPGIVDGQYFRMAFDDNGALALEWYQKKFAPGLSMPELLELAEKETKNSEGLIAKACANRYQGLDGFENVKHSHRHGHFVRAILESTAESLAALIKQVKGQGFKGNVVSTGGGARSRFWAQIKADKLGTVVYIPKCSETASLGAAMIAAKGRGLINNRFGNKTSFFEAVIPGPAPKKY